MTNGKVLDLYTLKIPQQLIYMDSTTYTSCQNQVKKQSKYYKQDSDDQFHSFRDSQLNQQVINELANIKNDIKSHLYRAVGEQYQENQQDQIKKVKDKLKMQRDNQQFVERIVAGTHNTKRRQQSQSITYYGSVDKRSSSQSLEFKSQKFKNSSPISPYSQNRVSLLQGSLQLQNKIVQPQPKDLSYKNILNLKSQKSSKTEQQQGNKISQTKAFPPSLQKTNLSDRFNLPYNLVTQFDNKSSSKQSNQNQNTSNIQKKNKNYRIQRPDQVYVELQQQIQKQKANKIKQKERQPKISVIVRQNINNIRAMLQKNTQNKPINKNNVHLPKNIIQQASNFPVISLSSTNNPGKFPVITSTCLFRLPSPSLYNKLKQLYTNEYYHKYCYQLSQEQIIIDNSYHIKYEDITKIKMIYNQFNRPQVKITYKSFKYFEVDPQQRRRREANVKNQIQTKQIQNNQINDMKSKSRQSFCVTEEEMKKSGDELVVFLCQCYQSVYTIFSCIIMRKMMTLVRNRFTKKEIKNINPNNPYNLTSFIVNTNLINTKKHVNDKNPSNHITFDYKIEGTIFKRSKHLKKWDRRYAKIEGFVLRTYRLQNISEKEKKQRQRELQKEKKQRLSLGINQSISSSSIQQSKTITSQATHNIQYSTSTTYIPQDYKVSPECTFQVETIKQLWTRFDTVDSKFIVMKLFKKNKFQKIQLGIPITNFCDIIDRGNWLFGLVSVLKGDA